MDFNSVNNLSMEGLEKQYNDIIEGADEFIACVGDYHYLSLYIKCDDGGEGTAGITGVGCNPCNNGAVTYTVGNYFSIYSYCDSYNDSRLMTDICGCFKRGRAYVNACGTR